MEIRLLESTVLPKTKSFPDMSLKKVADVSADHLSGDHFDIVLLNLVGRVVQSV